MTNYNDWHTEQARTPTGTFKPKWSKRTVQWIIGELRKATDFVDIQYKLVKEYKISMATAGMWVEMARRIMKDIDNGLSIDEALERDKERRNQLRRDKS